MFYLPAKIIKNQLKVSYLYIEKTPLALPTGVMEITKMIH